MPTLRFALILASLMATACASLKGPAATAARCSVGSEMIETRLFFGMSKPRGGAVSVKDWDQFVRAEITPRFPEGFSIVDGAGFWRDGATQETISEKSKIITRVHAATDEADLAVAAIIVSYKKRFEQEAVLRVDRPVCAQF